MATLKRHDRLRQRRSASVELDDAYFDVQPNIAGHAPGRHGPARRPAVRHPVDQDPRRGARRWRQAVAPEGHRPGPPGLDPCAALAGRRRHPRAQAPQLQAAHAQEDDPPGAGVGPVRPPLPTTRSSSSTRWGIDTPEHQGRRRPCSPSWASTGRVLVVLGRDEDDVAVWKSLRNLQRRPRARSSGELNAYDVLVSDWVVFTRRPRCREPSDGRRSTRRRRRGGVEDRVKDPRDVIVAPVVSEKSYALMDERRLHVQRAPLGLQARDPRRRAERSSASRSPR